MRLCCGIAFSELMPPHARIHTHINKQTTLRNIGAGVSTVVHSLEDSQLVSLVDDVTFLFIGDTSIQMALAQLLVQFPHQTPRHINAIR